MFLVAIRQPTCGVSVLPHKRDNQTVANSKANVPSVVGWRLNGLTRRVDVSSSTLQLDAESRKLIESLQALALLSGSPLTSFSPKSFESRPQRLPIRIKGGDPSSRYGTWLLKRSGLGVKP